MALLAIVVVYVFVTQMMLIPIRAELRDLVDEVSTVYEESTLLNDARLAELKADKNVQVTETTRIKKELEPYFVKDVNYVSEAAANIFSQMESQISGFEQFASRVDGKAKTKSCLIDEMSQPFRWNTPTQHQEKERPTIPVKMARLKPIRMKNKRFT